MVGQTIDARSSISKTTIFLLLITAGLVAWAAIAANPHPLIVALLPLSLAMALWFGQPAHVVVMIERDGFVPFGSPNKVYFSAIQSVLVGGVRYRADVENLPAAPIEIHHDTGCLTLPATLNVAPAELYRFLVAQMPVRPAKPVHALLAKYHAEQQQKFDSERIHLVHTREIFKELWIGRRHGWIAVSILFTGLVWLAVGISFGSALDDDTYGAWIFFGCLAILGGFFSYLALRYGKRSQSEALIAKNPDACIVIGPAGLAMVQGPVQGALRWDEITKVHMRGAQSFRISGGPGLLLMVAGGEIVVHDIYDRSTGEIEQLIRNHLDRP